MVRRPVPIMLVALLLVLGAWSAAFLEWRQPAFPADPQVQWSVGPFGAGDAFEQRFRAEISHLSRVEVSLRGSPGGTTDQGAVLHFRLRDGGVAVREGVVEVAGLINSRRVVPWSFPPIADSAGREYELQVVVAEVSGEGLLADTTTEDLLPGSIVSNGTPSGTHIDLVVHAYRQVSRRMIVDILGRTAPGGVVTLALAIGLACVTAAREDLDRVMTLVERTPSTPLAVSLRDQTLEVEGRPIAVGIEGPARDALLTGTWDATGLLLDDFDVVRGVAARVPYIRGF